MKTSGFSVVPREASLAGAAIETLAGVVFLFKGNLIPPVTNASRLNSYRCPDTAAQPRPSVTDPIHHTRAKEPTRTPRDVTAEDCPCPRPGLKNPRGLE